jgi:hypothetical protein
VHVTLGQLHWAGVGRAVRGVLASADRDRVIAEALSKLATDNVTPIRRTTTRRHRRRRLPHRHQTTARPLPRGCGPFGVHRVCGGAYMVTRQVRQ